MSIREACPDLSLSFDSPVKVQLPKRIRPASFTLLELEDRIASHEGVYIVFRTHDPRQVIKNAGIYNKGYPTKRSLARLPRITSTKELRERIRQYTKIGYVMYPVNNEDLRKRQGMGVLVRAESFEVP